MAVKLGDVFNYPGTESEDGLDTYYRNKGGWHIHLVVKTDESRGDAYLVPLSTVLRDRTCEIEVKDGCPLVTKPCVAAYIHGKKMRLRVLQEVGAQRPGAGEASRKGPRGYSDVAQLPAMVQRRRLPACTSGENSPGDLQSPRAASSVVNADN
jgi:hypothetical protein